MKYIIQAVPARQFYVEQLQDVLDDVEVYYDWNEDALEAFVETIKMAKGGAHVHLEDDILLSENFEDGVLAAVEKFPTRLITFFSLKNVTQTKLASASSFLMNQAFYLPEGYSTAILEFIGRHGLETWRESQSIDGLVRDFLKERQERYVLHHPSLVQHRVAKSIIDPRRSSKRQAKNFADDLN